MTTLKERFNEKFGGTLKLAAGGEVLPFFRQEFLALAEEIENDSGVRVPDRDQVVDIIRSKADELV